MFHNFKFIINSQKRSFFSPKIFLRNIGDYPPKNDILTGGKGGYGGEGPPYGGGRPHARGGVLVIFIYPPPPMSYPQLIHVDNLWT